MQNRQQKDIIVLTLKIVSAREDIHTKEEKKSNGSFHFISSLFMLRDLPSLESLDFSPLDFTHVDDKYFNINILILVIFSLRCAVKRMK